MRHYWVNRAIGNRVRRMFCQARRADNLLAIIPTLRESITPTEGAEILHAAIYPRKRSHGRESCTRIWRRASQETRVHIAEHPVLIGVDGSSEWFSNRHVTS
jgi:hypothetical protein